jgi:hypothetical protein
LIKMRPSGAKAIAHGVSRPEMKMSTFGVAAERGAAARVAADFAVGVATGVAVAARVGVAVAVGTSVGEAWRVAVGSTTAVTPVAVGAIACGAGVFAAAVEAAREIAEASDATAGAGGGVGVVLHAARIRTASPSIGSRIGKARFISNLFPMRIGRDRRPQRHDHPVEASYAILGSCCCA